MAGRKKSAYPTKNKQLAIRVSDNDILRLKNISEKYNLVYLDIIKEGCICILNDDNLEYSQSSTIKDKRLSIRVSEDEIAQIKNILNNSKFLYYDALMIGLKHYESKK